MIDVTLETVRALILLGIALFLWRIGRRRFEANREGWNLIVAGFGLLLFGSLIDITDNFETLNRFVVVGDTGMQAFLEKFVGFLGGFLVLAWGLVLWMPRTQRLSSEIERGDALLHGIVTTVADGILTIDELKVKFGEELPAAIAEMGDAEDATKKLKAMKAVFKKTDLLDEINEALESLS